MGLLGPIEGSPSTHGDTRQVVNVQWDDLCSSREIAQLMCFHMDSRNTKLSGNFCKIAIVKIDVQIA